MDIFGLIIALSGSIILTVGAVGKTPLRDAQLSISKIGFNLDLAKSFGRQRISSLVGIVVYVLGNLIVLVSIVFPPDHRIIFLYLGILVGAICLTMHFIIFIPAASRKSMLTTMKLFYFEEDNRRSSWDSDNSAEGWRSRQLKQLGLDENLTKEKFETIIKAV
ncbi:hypothetical protein KKI23_03455 [Patescibacteria group bacterium]|nr:hypothetical protein [Patescibacteria group bacterium]